MVLIQIINLAESLTASEYTPVSWGSLQTALRAAQATEQDQNATAADQQLAADDLQAAIDALRSIDQVADKNELYRQLEQAEIMAAADYLPTTWKIFDDAVRHGRLIAGDPTATQVEVDEALSQLIHAQGQLTKLKTEQTSVSPVVEPQSTQQPAPKVEPAQSTTRLSLNTDESAIPYLTVKTTLNEAVEQLRKVVFAADDQGNSLNQAIQFDLSDVRFGHPGAYTAMIKVTYAGQTITKQIKIEIEDVITTPKEAPVVVTQMEEKARIKADSDYGVTVVDAPNGNPLPGELLADHTLVVIDAKATLPDQSSWYQVGVNQWLPGKYLDFAAAIEPIEPKKMTPSILGHARVLGEPGYGISVYEAPDSKKPVGLLPTFTHLTLMAKQETKSGLWYQVGPAAWLPANQVILASKDYQITDLDVQGEVVCKPGYGIEVFKSPSPEYSTNRYLPAGSKWSLSKRATYPDGTVWYSVGPNQWVAGDFIKRDEN